MAGAVLQFVIKAKDEASAVVSAATKNVQGDVKALDSTISKLGQSFGLTDNQSASLAKGLPILAAAASAVGGAAIAAATGIFALAKKASDAGSEIFDAGQKTNASAEFLSVLKVAAEQSGSSFEASAAKITKWSSTLVDAAKGNKELTTDLKRFGIDASEAYRNPEAALKTFIERFNQLPPSAANNAAAMKLFKDRSGEIIPVLRAFGTDYEGLVRKLDASGQIWTKEGTEKADEFGDSLVELGQTASGIGNVFAREVMPDITSAMKDITKSVVENKSSFKEWGRAVGDIIRGVRTVLDGNGNTIINWLTSIALAFNPILAGVQVLRQIGATSRGTTEPGAGDPGRRFGGFANAPSPASPDTLAPADVVNETVAKAAARSRDSARRKAQAEAERESERQAGVVKRLTDSYAQLAAEVEHFNDSQVEQQIVQMRLTSGVETLTGQRRKDAESLLDLTAQELRNLDVKKQLHEQGEKAKRQSEQEAEYATRAIRLLDDLLEPEHTQLDMVRDFIYEASKAGVVIDENIGKILKLTAAASDLAKVPLDAEALRGLGELAVPIPQGTGPTVDSSTMGLPPPDFENHMKVIDEFKNFALDAWDSIAGGFGSMIESFLLGGDLSLAGFAKMTKGILASLASQALVEALMEVARGIAELAKAAANPLTAPQHIAAAHLHFAAAKAFGVVGGVAAVAAIAIPGGGGRESSFGSTSEASRQPNNQNFAYGSTFSTPASSDVGGGSRYQGKPGPGAAIAGALNKLNGQLSRMGSMPAGHVVTMGAPDAREAIGVAVLQYSGSDDSFNDDLARNLRVA